MPCTSNSKARRTFIFSTWGARHRRCRIASRGSVRDTRRFSQRNVSSSRSPWEPRLACGVFVGCQSPATTYRHLRRCCAITFRDKYSLKVGRQVRELSYHGDGHEPGNIFIHAPAQKTLTVNQICESGPPFGPLRDRSPIILIWSLRCEQQLQVRRPGLRVVSPP